MQPLDDNELERRERMRVETKKIQHMSDPDGRFQILYVPIDTVGQAELLNEYIGGPYEIRDAVDGFGGVMREAVPVRGE